MTLWFYGEFGEGDDAARDKAYSNHDHIRRRRNERLIYLKPLNWTDNELRDISFVYVTYLHTYIGLVSEVRWYERRGFLS